MQSTQVSFLLTALTWQLSATAHACPPLNHTWLSVWQTIDLFDRILRVNNLGLDFEEAMRQNPRPQEPLFDALRITAKTVDKVQKNFETESAVFIKNQIDKLHIDGELRELLTGIAKSVSAIDAEFKSYFEIYINRQLYDFVEVLNMSGRIAFSREGGLIHTINSLRLQCGIFHNGSSVFNLLRVHIETNYPGKCSDDLSGQQEIFNLFENIILWEAKGFLLLTIANMYREYNSLGGNYVPKINYLTTSTNEALTAYVTQVQKSLKDLQRDVCPATSPSSELSAIQLRGPFQGIIIDDASTNPVCDSDRECTNTKKAGMLNRNGDICNVSGKNFCAGQSCYNEMTDCESMAHNEIEICETTPQNSTRRYDFVKLALNSIPGIYYRNKTTCCLTRSKNVKAEWYMGSPDTIAQCSFCICTCTESGWRNTDIRAISFLEEKSAFYGTNVITGVRFVEKNGMIHLQVKQGKLLPKGKIQSGSEFWKPLKNIQRRFRSADPRKSPEYYYVDDTGENKLVEHVNYVHISKDDKTISLSDIVVPKDYVITGVKLQHERNPFVSRDAVAGDPIELQITATPFDYETGRFTETFSNPSLYRTASKNGTSHKRQEIVFDHPDTPTAAESNEIYSEPNQIVNFRVTDYRKDAGQTVIPFFDGQDIEVKPSSPLAGLSLRYRGSSGYGGFITLKALTLDIYDHFSPNLTLSELTANCRKNL